MASPARSRRRATAIAVPGTVAVLLAGAYAAAPALAASNAPALPFPTVCPTGSAGRSGGSSAPSASASTTASPSATPSRSAATPPSSPSASASASASASTSAPAKDPAAPASPSAGPTASPTGTNSGNGFWGWLNGVWTWIFSDAPQTSAAQPVAQDAVAPLSGGGHVVDVAAGVGARQAAPSPSAGCIPADEASSLAAAAAASPSEGVTACTVPWVMKTPSMVGYGLTFNGVKSVKILDPNTKKYVDENVLDFTMDSLTIKSMVTYSIQNGQTVYNNAGSGTTTTLTSPHLMVLSMTADLYGLIGQHYTPTNLPPLPVGLKVPIPIVFTNVTSVIAYLNTQAIQVPGFNGFASSGVASPQ